MIKFDNNEALINPDHHMDRRSSKKYSTLIATFSDKLIDELIEQNLIQKIENVVNDSVNRHTYAYEIIGTDIAIALTMIGASACVALLEEMMYSLYAKNIVMFGSCGVLNKDIVAGHIIVPTKAYREEGTSFHYIDSNDPYIEILGSPKTIKVFKDLNIDFVSGYTWTTDGIFRETRNKIVQRRNEGCLCVEMEISAIEAFARFRNYNFYPFIYSADNLDTDKWDARILGNLSLDKRLVHYKLALALAKCL